MNKLPDESMISQKFNLILDWIGDLLEY